MEKIFEFKGIWILLGYITGIILQLPFILKKPGLLEVHVILLVIGIIIILIINRKKIKF